MKIRRREFLKMTVAAGAVAAVGVPRLNAFADTPPPRRRVRPRPNGFPPPARGAPPGVRWSFSSRRGGWSRRGEPVFQGQRWQCLPPRSPDDPADVRSGPGQGAHEADQPQKGRGVDPKFVPITWDEALDTVADKMMELRKANEPEKLMYMRGRYSPTSTDLLYGTLPKIFGTPTTSPTAPSAPRPEKMGPGYTQGFFGYRDYDLARTKCLVVWGLRPVKFQPSGAQCHRQVRRHPRPRNGHRRRSPSLRLGRQGERVAAHQAGGRRRPGRLPSPTSS